MCKNNNCIKKINCMCNIIIIVTNFMNNAQIYQIKFLTFEEKNNKWLQLLLCNVIMLTKIKFI